MKHYLTTRVRVVLVVAVLLAVLLAVVSNLTGLKLPEMAVQGILTPMRAGVSKLKDQAEQLYSYMFNYEALQAENIALKEKISQMEDNARVADSVSRENDRLRALLDLVDAHADYKLVDAYIIAWGSNDWSETLTINRGTNIGIAVGMCAITANGEVVGQVIEVGSNYAVIKTVLDASLGISATIASSGYNGIVQGNYTEGREDLLRMNYLPSDSVIRNRDQVVTSGSTNYPRDLILGYVVDADFDDTGIAKFALLEPAADIDTLEQVFIITEYNAG
jgi:rod shape-determining protein MreC